MKKYLILLLMVLGGGAIYVLQKMNIPLPVFFNNYLNDLLVIPITCWLVLIIIRKWKSPNFKVKGSYILSISLYFSVYFEYYLPKYENRYTGDWIDVICYFTGGFIFYLLQKKLPKGYI